MSINDEKQDVGKTTQTQDSEVYDNLWFQAKLEEEPGRYDLWLLLGQRLKNNGDIGGAINALKRATELKPDSSVAWLYLAIAHRSNGDIEEAGHAWIKAKTFSSDFDLIPINL